jgi:hypothetical protein
VEATSSEPSDSSPLPKEAGARLRLGREFNNMPNELHVARKDTAADHLRSYGRVDFATLRRLRKAWPGRRKRVLDAAANPAMSLLPRR